MGLCDSLLCIDNKMQKSAEMTDSYSKEYVINRWLEVPGDTDLADGDWRVIDAKVVTDAPPSSFDPTAKYKWPLAA